MCTVRGTFFESMISKGRDVLSYTGDFLMEGDIVPQKKIPLLSIWRTRYRRMMLRNLSQR